jgi:hypothetical protein
MCCKRDLEMPKRNETRPEDYSVIENLLRRGIKSREK